MKSNTTRAVRIITGNQAAALAAKNAKVRVVAAYPITPATPVVEELSKMVETGEMKAHFILVESEHSAMAACIGASAAGSRTFTATSSHGLAYMHELLHYATNARTPVVMAVANRAIGPGWNIWADLSDSISQRDTGWMQFYCSDNQEIYDTIIMAYRIAEHRDVLLPAMVCYDGFVLSHTAMPIEITDVNDFIDEYHPVWRLDFDEPSTHGNILPPDYFMELRREVCEAHERALKVMKEVEREFYEYSGRLTPLILEEYRLEDADVAMVTMGAISSEAKIAVDELRKRGVKAGLLRLKAFRPFPKQEVVEKLGSVEKVYVFDRSVSPGFDGQLFSELKAVLWDLRSPPEVYGRIVGLGGRDVTSRVFEKAVLGELDKKWVMEVIY
jgi:pyruvate/2-oxoacid:ferredoxin oxidoreductase alpha subunit